MTRKRLGSKIKARFSFRKVNKEVVQLTMLMKDQDEFIKAQQIVQNFKKSMEK